MSGNIGKYSFGPEFILVRLDVTSVEDEMDKLF